MTSVSAIFYLPEKLKKNSENIKKVHIAALEFKEKSKAFTVDIQNINELVRNDCVPPYLTHMTFPCLLIGRFSGGQIRIEENYTGVKKILKWIDEQYGDGDEQGDEPDDERDDERDDKGNKIPPAPAPTREADDDGGDGFGVVGDFDKNEDDDDIEDIHEGEFANLKKESKFQLGERERQREQRERQQEMAMKRREPVQRRRRLPKSDDDFEDEVEKVPDEDDTISSSSSKTGKKIGTGKISAEELTAQQEKIEKDRKDSLEKLRKEFEMSDKQKKNRGRFELQ